MSDRRRPFAATFDDRSVDPLAGEVGCFDELVPKIRSRSAEERADEKPWLETALIAFVILTGYVFGILAFAKL